MRARSATVILCFSLLPVGCGDLEAYSSPEQVFEATFGSEPSPSIRGLQAYGRMFRDNSDCYLKFQVAEPQLDRLLGSGFMPWSADEFETRVSYSFPAPIPVWWKPLTGSPTVFLHSNAFHPGFYQGEAIVSYNPESRVVYIFWNGND